MLHPSQWPKETISGQVVGGGGPIDQQSISVPNSNQFYVVNRPLDIQAPPNPNPNNLGGPSWIARPHYCLVAEARQKRKCSSMWPGWPSDQIEEFTTVQDYANWCAACPLVCVRNVNWVPCDRKPGEKCLTWCCGTQLTIPECSFTSTFWTIIIECDSPIIPPGCKCLSFTRYGSLLSSRLTHSFSSRDLDMRRQRDVPQRRVLRESPYLYYSVPCVCGLPLCWREAGSCGPHPDGHLVR
ncbi:hypothetical protein L210DRAFT_3053110 [Boletus edulis BED1]|nr:hypothetical protein L210DRAFT_3053110 [Boletus edulis BED1]